MTNRLATLWLVALLSGCSSVVPGINMDETADPEAWTPAGEPAVDFVPEIVSIDADLLLAQRRAQRADASDAGPARRDLAEDYQYRIGPGDVINVVVWGHPELSNPMGQSENIEGQARLVREDGTIFFPFLGVVPVAGRTVEQVRDALATDLARFVTNPQVDVRIVNFRSQKVYITGEVREPGVVPLTDQPLTVLDAINLAGGFNETANRRRAVITRGDQAMTLDILELYSSGRGDLLLEDRDVLFVPDNQSNRVFVMGETMQQRAVPLHDGRLTLAEALTDAGGINLAVADTRNIYVLRGNEVFDANATLRGIRPEIFHLDARSGTALILAEAFELEPRDIIYVSSTDVVRFNRVMLQILPTVQTIWQTDAIIND
jgi:polysaccharide biosynthesis/export protein